MNKYGWMIAVILFILLIFYIEPFRNSPYQPTVKAGAETVETVQGSYCWAGLIMARCVDTAFVGPMDMATAVESTQVQPNDKVTISFTKDPIEDQYEVSLWSDETTSKPVMLQEGYFLAPDEPGTYIYGIRANWSQGDGNFVFSLEVK